MTQIVLISGKQGSGKTTLANALQKQLQLTPGTRAAQLTFASVIYEIHDFALGRLETYGIKRNIKKDGPLLQLLGTEWGRNTIHDNIWVEVLKGRIAHESQHMAAQNKIFIISDCRFKNEFDGFPGSLKIRLECDKETRKERCSMWRENDRHPSEIDLDDYVAQKKFDFAFFTETISANKIATIIAAKLGGGIY